MKHSYCSQGVPALLSRGGTIAPNGSEFSHRAWISIFLFYVLVLSLQKFTASRRIVPMHANILRNTKGRSSRKIIAGVISQWFWCKKVFRSYYWYPEREIREKNVKMKEFKAFNVSVGVGYLDSSLTFLSLGSMALGVRCLVNGKVVWIPLLEVVNFAIYKNSHFQQWDSNYFVNGLSAPGTLRKWTLINYLSIHCRITLIKRTREHVSWFSSKDPTAAVNSAARVTAPWPVLWTENPYIKINDWSLQLLFFYCGIP